MLNIKTATVLGANGAMGSGSAAILASFGNIKVNMLARDLQKAEQGIQNAVKAVRSSVLEKRMQAGTYDQDLERAVSQSDWIFECVAETYPIKEEINKKIAKARKPGSIVSTVSSGLSISRLASHFDEDGQKHYYGTHFFNPPYKLTLCELVTHKKNDNNFTQEFTNYLSKVLMRHVIITNDTPAFAGNRIGFQLMNEAAIYAQKYQDKGGIYLMDTILGPYTGRAMSPLATVDLVGLDVHKAIVDNIYEQTNDSAHETFKMPNYFEKLIAKGSLGMKTKKGLYTQTKDSDGKKLIEVYDISKDNYVSLPKLEIAFKKECENALKLSDYKKAILIMKEAKGLEADILRHFIARYISYSFSLIPEVTNQNGIDGAMGFGFSWLVPSAWVDLWGGVSETCKFIEKQNLPVPEFLSKVSGNGNLYKLQKILDYRSLFRAS